MFNMLIAIMGDTFDKVTEHRDVNATKSKLELMADLVAILEQEEKEDNKEIFFFTVQPEADDEEDEEQDEWMGTIKTMSRVINKTKSDLKGQISENCKGLENRIEEFVSQGEVMNQNYKEYVEEVSDKSAKDVRENINGMDERFEKQLNELKGKIVERIKQRQARKEEKKE